MDEQLNEVLAREEVYEEGIGDEGNIYTDMEKWSRGDGERFEEECIDESIEVNTEDEEEMERDLRKSVLMRALRKILKMKRRRRATTTELICFQIWVKI